MVVVKAWDYMTWRGKPGFLNRTGFVLVFARCSRKARFLLIRRHHLEKERQGERERDKERNLVCRVEKFTCNVMFI